MIIEDITLENFGVYRGRQSMDLIPPSPDKPIVLIGGPNGGGKTTLLDALQLALYGKLAQCSNRGSLAYDEYLRRSVHRSGRAKKAAVEVRFRHTADGEEHTFRVCRSWSVNGKTVRERLEVARNDWVDDVLTEQWDEHVEAFIPLRVSHLFFFDGDKIQDLADLDNSARLLSTAVESLLGLDIVDRLKTDLTTLERRKRTERSNDAERQQIKETEQELEGLEHLRDELVTQRGAAQNELDQREKVLRGIEVRYRKEGGDLYAQREKLEAQRKEAARRLRKYEDGLREIATGPAPLLLVGDLLSAVDKQDRLEEEALQGKALSSILAKRDAKVLRKLQAQRVSKRARDKLKDFMTQDRGRLTAAASTVCYLGLDTDGREGLRELCTKVLPGFKKRVARLVKDAQRERRRLQDLDRKLAGVPRDEAIAALTQEREKARASVEEAKMRLAALDVERDRARRACDSKQAQLVSQIEKTVNGDFERDAVSRLLQHSMRVRETLDGFHTALVKRNVRRIEQLVLDSYRRLLRKRRLVSDLRIDPGTFALELRAADGRTLSPDRLSAGERQLLALSVLWALARASGRPLPTVIDTPLGRLDSSHRSHLVEWYFPFASHQVVLLSTDREVDEAFHDRLRRWIGREYRLEHNDDAGGTKIEQGYYW